MGRLYAPHRCPYRKDAYISRFCGAHPVCCYSSRTARALPRKRRYYRNYKLQFYGEKVSLFSTSAGPYYRRPNQDYITLVHACLYIATPFAPISALSKPFELKHVLKLSKATCLFVDEKLLSTVLPVAKELGISSRRIFLMSGHTPGRQSFSQLIDATQKKKADIIPVRPVQRDTLAYLIFSSGTTGLPKGD